MSADSPMAVVNRYLARLEKAFDHVPPAERDELVEELRSHVLERIEAEPQVTAQLVDEPVFPGRIGLWLRPEQTLTLGYWDGRFSGTQVYGLSVRPPASFVLGTLSPTEGPVRELLGPWLFPVGVLCGGLFIVGTTLLTRWFIRRFGPRKWSRPGGPVPAAC